MRMFSAHNRPKAFGSSEVEVFIVAGQSNALGSDIVAPATPYQGAQTNCKIWTNAPYTDANVFAWKPLQFMTTTQRREDTDPGSSGYNVNTGWGVELVGACNLRDYSGKTIYVIKSAQGGQPIAAWNSGSTLYNELINGIINGVAAIPGGTAIKFRGFAWLQGETDALTGTDATTYTTKLSTLIGNVRGVSDNNIPVFLFRLSANQTSYTSTDRDRINGCYDAVAASMKRVFVINTDDLATRSDNIHYSAASLQTLGNRFFNSMVNSAI